MKFASILFILNLGLMPFSAFADDDVSFNQSIKLKGRHIGDAKVTISEESGDNPRIQSKLIVNFDNLTDAVDSYMKSLGNIGKCSVRLYWIGDTEIVQPVTLDKGGENISYFCINGPL